MSVFTDFREKVRAQLDLMLSIPGQLYLTGVNGDELWDLYLDSFPEGTNEVFRERREYDCACCRSFIRHFGGVVSIRDNEPVSIWEIENAGDTFQPVADALAALVKSHPIVDVFITKTDAYGVDVNYEQAEDNSVTTWNHFQVDLPSRLIAVSSKSVPALMGEARTTYSVFKRSLEELSMESVGTVLDLIDEQTLYRGDQWKSVLEKFEKLQLEYFNLPEEQRDPFCWHNSVSEGGAMTRIRNHSIGTLLQDITKGEDILEAVKKYEAIVAPWNYQRPKPVFSTRMVDRAQQTIEELGLTQSLPRRHARLSDVKVTDVKYVDRDAEPHMNGANTIFEVLKSDVPVEPKKFQYATPIDIDDFMADLVDMAQIDVLLENRHAGNLVSLTAPQNEDSPSLFKWNNGFSWAYAGNMADSSKMKEEVRAKGGDVTGVLRFSIMWNDGEFDRNDLDAHCREPGGRHIYFHNRGYRHASSGKLDVDITNPRRGHPAVENITYSILSRMPVGDYRFHVKNYAHRGGRNGFSAEIEFGGQIFAFRYNKNIPGKCSVDVATVRLNEDGTFEMVSSLPSTTSRKELWGLKTNQWQRVSLLTLSPNYWDGQVGNKHYLFMLAGCVNEETPSGFFNEYLREDFREHRKVFAALGDRMRVAQTDNQLSGLGFSSTQRNSVIVRVNNQKLYKIVI